MDALSEFLPTLFQHYYYSQLTLCVEYGILTGMKNMQTISIMTANNM